MPKFETKYIHVQWSDELDGKHVFFANDVSELLFVVENNIYASIGVVRYSGDDSKPFKDQQFFYPHWKFVYYNPYNSPLNNPYYVLRVAHEQGEAIQAKHRLTGEWVDMNGKNIDWDMVEKCGCELRIKPKQESVTNCELAQWLAEGYGQYMHTQISKAKYHFEYAASEDDTPLHKDIRVRVFGDTEWHEPTREYMGV